MEPLSGVDLVGHETIYADLYYPTKQKIREPTCHFGGKVEHENFIPESIEPNIVKSFFYVKKSSHYMFSSVKAFQSRLREPK